MQNVNQRIGKVIRNIREQKGLSQEKLAEMCEVHEKYVSRLERGLHDVTLKFLYKLSAGLGVSIHDLIKSIFGAEKNDGEKDKTLQDIQVFLQTLPVEDLKVVQRLLLGSKRFINEMDLTGTLRKRTANKKQHKSA